MSTDLEIAITNYRLFTAVTPSEDAVRRMQEMLDKGMFKGHCDGQAKVIGQIVGSEDALARRIDYEVERYRQIRQCLIAQYKCLAGTEPSEKALSKMMEYHRRRADSPYSCASHQYWIECGHKKLVEAEARAIAALSAPPHAPVSDGLPIGAPPLTPEEFALKRLATKKSRSSRRREKNRLIKEGFIRLSDDILRKNVEKATQERVRYERTYAEFLA